MWQRDAVSEFICDALMWQRDAVSEFAIVLGLDTGPIR